MQTRLISCLLTLVLVTATGLPVAAEARINDLSADHWAYESVVEMIDKGYLSLHSNNEFRGAESVTRYQLAEVVAQLIERVGQEETRLNEEEFLTLKKLATEFRTELTEVVSKSQQVSEAVSSLGDGQEILEEDLVKAHDRLQKLEQEFSDLLKELNQQAQAIKGLREEIDQLDNRNQTLNERVKNLETRLEAEADDTTISQRVTSLEAQVATLQNRLYWGGAIGGTILLFSIAVN